MSNSLILPVAATGTTQATATPIPIFTQMGIDVSPVPSGSGIILPISQTGSNILISNIGANTLNIYPPFFGAIDGGIVNTPITLAAGSKIVLYSVSSTSWSINWVSFTGGGGGGAISLTTTGTTGVSTLSGTTLNIPNYQGQVALTTTGSTGPATFTTNTLNIPNYVSVSGISEISETTSFTAVAGNFYAISGSGAVTATLPTAVGISGQTIRIRCVGGYTGLCTITGTSGQTISGQTSRIVYTGESPLLQSDGANWVRTGGTVIPCECRLTLGTAQPVTSSGSETIINCNTISSDNSGQMGLAASASNQITIFRPGRYLVGISSFIGALSTTQAYNIQIQAFKNAASISVAAQAPVNPTAPNEATIKLHNSDLVNLVAGDLLTLVFLQVNPGATTETVANGEVTAIQAIEIPSW